MKAIGCQKGLPADDPAALEEIEIDTPVPGPRDLLVEVKAVSVNPVDYKMRKRTVLEEGHKVLGYDAAGIVTAVGDEASLFKPGDAVWYAGDITRNGTNMQFHAVDERIVGPKPTSLSMAEAAALPLTSITAWELLFDSFRLEEGAGKGHTLLIIGGAGGVGSILIQLARQLTALTIVATASRAETIDWCRDLGAHHVISHREALATQLETLGLTPRYVAMLTASDQHFAAVTDLIEPRGHIGLIDDPGDADFMRLKEKSLSFHWEFMFTRAMFQTADMSAQHQLLSRVSQLVDEGRVKTTLKTNLGPLTGENLRRAHLKQESGASIGKTVLEAAWE